MDLKRYFDDVEARIDAVQEKCIAEQWKQFCDLKCTQEVFSPSRIPAPTSIEWPKVYINHAIYNMELMIYTQLKTVSDILETGSGLLLSVRPNYGVGIIPSMFGAELFWLDEKADTLPCSKPLEGGLDRLKDIVSARRMDYSRGLAPQVFEFAHCWKEVSKEYPLIDQFVHIYNPDLQGPFPLVDALVGSSLYYAFYDDEDLVHDALDFMTEVYIDFTDKWQKVCPPFETGYSVEWGLLHKGYTMLRNDAVMNLSEAMYREFVMPYDGRIFQRFGGGMHFCGRGDHYIQAACELEGLSCINLSQPELNDMEKIYNATIYQEKIIVGMVESEILRARADKQSLLGRVHCGAALSAYRKED